MKSPKLIRYDKNPILEPTKNWWERKSVFNTAAAVYRNKIYLLYRGMGSVPVSNFGLAVLSDPFTVEKRYPTPVLTAREEDEKERLGIEDGRISFIDDRYYIIYVSASLNMKRLKPHPWSHSGTPWRIRLSQAVTHDFKSFIHHGTITGSSYETKDGALFPGKIRGKYALLHRPFPDIWISYSDSITSFDKGIKLCEPRKKEWDNDRIGAGAPPIKTPLGWLEIYHGVEKLPDKRFKYMIGILLLDINDPTKILYRSNEPILGPVKSYEREGLVHNVVFTCGAIEWEEKYYIYYGGGDKVIGVSYINKSELLDYISKKIRIK